MKRNSPREKVVLVLIDGIGDVNVPELQGKTPLEAAVTPFMDAVAGTNTHIMFSNLSHFPSLFLFRLVWGGALWMVSAKYAHLACLRHRRRCQRLRGTMRLARDGRCKEPIPTCMP